jgi:hypothetical protein
MKIVIGLVGIFALAVAVSILAAKNRDWLTLAISVVGVLTIAVVALAVTLQPGH